MAAIVHRSHRSGKTEAFIKDLVKHYDKVKNKEGVVIACWTQAQADYMKKRLDELLPGNRYKYSIARKK